MPSSCGNRSCNWIDNEKTKNNPQNLNVLKAKDKCDY